ncbi:MAG: 23S rRNA (adenine(2503)-C(2))-methyltransferase RlmN [Candidatus Riflebacteria bacterium]|nr:23S rRNA (adenine(2503)-C(2))-methyltransferase RlmN [Candidatus Riflebacteria bacterium]
MKSESTTDLTGLTRDEMVNLVRSLGGTSVQARRLARSLHDSRVPDVRAIPGVAARLLAKLAEVAHVGRLVRCGVLRSATSEGTRKLLCETTDRFPVESVLFPSHQDRLRLTLCLSSQAGCRMGCAFCATGALGFRRQLTAGEMVAQVWEALALMDRGEFLNNVVFMGMGEPFDNFGEVSRAIRILHADEGFRLAYDKITLSTCGLLPGMESMARELPRVALALSLHSVRNATRNQLVPCNRRYPVEALLSFLRTYPKKGCKAFCIEYCLMAGLNDSEAEAVELAQALEGIVHKIHLIPLNPVPGLPFERPTEQAIRRFADAARLAGGSIVLRDSRGEDIAAACGQLGASHLATRAGADRSAG